MWYLQITVLFLTAYKTAGNEIYLGGIFDENPEDEETFIWAVNKANKQLSYADVTFRPVTKKINSNDSFNAMQTTCSFLSRKTVAILGPRHEENINTVQSICDYKDIAHIITRWIHEPQYKDIINLYPKAESLSAAYLTIISRWEWKSFTVLYENIESFLRVSDLIKRAKQAGIVVSVKQLDETDSKNYRISLKDALQSGETNFVLDCSIEILEEVLVHAQQVGVLTSNYKYFITNLDFETINLEPFQHSDANITGIRLVTPPDYILDALDLSHEDFYKLKTEAALIIDAVSIVTRAIAGSLYPLEQIDENELSCSSQTNLKHGTRLFNDIMSTYHEGLTGMIEFDEERHRSNIELDILELHENGTVKIGTWHTERGINLIRPIGEPLVEDPLSLKNKTFRIITCLTPPYGMLKETAQPLTGNDRFEGFSIDLIHELSLMEGFNYTFLIREDKANGKQLANGSWSGMIGDVMDGRADLAITDLTITAEREQAVDFTSPFMNLGISILAKQPEKAPPSFFSFADPFAIDTWLMLSLAYVIVSVSYFIVGRLCPDEWNNPYPCIEEPEYLINQFSLKNSFWFAIGSLMQQGTEIAPIGVSTRMVAGMWWFFILIIVSSYTANLAAFLTTENAVNLFTDVDSLVENMEKHDLRLGAKANGATAGFFKDKEDPTYKAIYEYMETHPEDMVGENDEGVKLAEKGKYAFFMESVSILYETQRHCSLQQYGGLLDDKGYGIAMRKNSTYRKRLSTAILKMQSSGDIDKIRRKWWEERRGGGQCSAKEESAPATPLSLENVKGVFYVTIGGTILSIISVIIEMMIVQYQISKKAKIPFKEALKIEWEAYKNFSSDVKAPIQINPESKSGSGSSHKTNETSNNNLRPTPYGFIPTVSVSQEDLAEKNL